MYFSLCLLYRFTDCDVRFWHLQDYNRLHYGDHRPLCHNIHAHRRHPYVYNWYIVCVQWRNFPNRGLYCATHGGRRSNIPLHHCKSNCLQSSQCTAVNYNVSDATCTEMSTPCALAIYDSTMIYMLFNERVREQCFTWIMHSELTSSHTRQVYDKNGKKRVSRILYQSGFYPASSDDRWCYTGTGIELINRENNVCEVLILSPSCTEAWVPYEAGQPLPSGAETAGITEEGEATYPVMFAPEIDPDHYRIGYYTVASGYGMITYGSAHHHATAMMMLVLIWLIISIFYLNTN